MQYRNKKWLHTVLVLALLAAPLRAGWAMPMADTIDNGSPCAQMHDNAQPGGMTDYCCDTECNMSDCNSCVHVSAAIPAVLAMTTGVPGSLLSVSFLDRLTERTSPPLLRPPATL